MAWSLPAEGLNLLLTALLQAQLGLRAVLHALGLAPDIHGQPAWPFAYRIAGEMLALEPGHARRVVICIACLLLAGLSLLVSLAWRRARPGLWVLAAAVLLLAPWPEPHLLLAPAVPTSLHASPTGFTAQAIVRGQRVYQQQCVRCHGADGRGEGVEAAQLPMWPPTLNGSLLWKRLDGELFWRVRHGMRARDGSSTMPGFGPPLSHLSDTQVWEVLDYLQAHAAGQMLQESGAWTYPVRMPDAAVQCRHQPPRTLHSLDGQRLRVVADAASVQDDPRLVTVNLATNASDPECQANTPELRSSLALVLGVQPAQLAGHQLLVDRDGWLRARGQPGQADWSASDLVCRSGAAPVALASTAAAGDGLDGLIRRMDFEPVRLLRGGFPH
ncbi:Cytochrome c, mono-and diheme variants [Rhodoferax sp. OV413]|uniref:c-type cytochrome n=1 Tax=Rhodoferax sp. OV413 TaxID=1855285 RepID=UPI000881E4FA|nr:cytochrome c [Rhodoferax sp. OV413]SDP41934.1 Cytochrome c, mono-and diheme variants [Rhodoferax sp. OV413]